MVPGERGKDIRSPGKDNKPDAVIGTFGDKIGGNFFYYLQAISAAAPDDKVFRQHTGGDIQGQNNIDTFLPGDCLLKARSEEHTSELQSRPHLVCRLLLEKKKKSRNQKSHSLYNENGTRDRTR